ncbi:TetR/AcrR family transcriptional regulator [Kitasatospora sp. NPDC001175]|uniref:TetR/AcrR family transcriptional regulator n=1 Tax=Kitasatospora sp. NPDC001175 TaxID=3157103 RepID=UPI003CFDCAA5
MTDQERVLGHQVAPGTGDGSSGLDGTGGLGGISSGRAGLHSAGQDPGGSGAPDGPGGLGTAGGVVPEQRGPGAGELYGSATHGVQGAYGTHGAYSAQTGHGAPGSQSAYGANGTASAPGAHGGYGASEDSPRAGAPSRLRVDARRNLESVLRAARQVFGELGYDAPMEEVARRAGVGVGTVYRRFPSKEVLVQRIAAEEVTWLTEQARESLYGSSEPWEALAGYLARAVGSGAGRLLPPSAFRYAEELGESPVPHVSEQRLPEHTVPEQHFAEQRLGTPGFPPPQGIEAAHLGPDGFGAKGFGTQSPDRPGFGVQGGGERRVGEFGFTEPWVPEQRAAEADAHPAYDADPRLLLHLLAALVARAGAAGELRPGVTVSDVVLVLTAAVPVHVSQGHPARGTAAGSGGLGSAGERGTGAWEPDGRAAGELTEGSPGDRLLQILLNGLRAR